MATTSEPVTCRRCGNIDSGTYCSECGAKLAPGNALVEAGMTFTRPLWEYAALLKDVVLTRDLVEKIRSGRIDLQRFIEFSLTGATICALIGAYYPKSKFIEDGPPFFGDLVFCLSIIVLSVTYNSAMHLFLRRRNSEVSYLESIILIATIFSVALPAMQLANPDKDSDKATAFGAIVVFGMIFLIFRANKLMYEVRYRDVMMANVKAALWVLMPLCLVALLTGNWPHS